MPGEEAWSIKPHQIEAMLAGEPVYECRAQISSGAFAPPGAIAMFS